MFNVINLISLPDLSVDELEKTVSRIADHIENNLDVRVEQSCLEVLCQTRDRAPTLEVLDGLRKITQVAFEKGLYETLKLQLKFISNLCKEIIVANPNFQIAEKFNPEMLCKILYYSNLTDFNNISTVAKLWKEAASLNQIKEINEGKLTLKELLKGFTAMEVVEWITSRYGENLLLADFTDFNDFDNDCLEKLTKQCPNLKHLSISSSEINGDALKHLYYTPQLQSLSMNWCQQLERDALKHLQNTPQLQSLSMRWCCQLEQDALKHLQYISQLQSLNIDNCFQLERDALKHLHYTPQLQSLSIDSCEQLERDTLKHLQYTPQLLSLSLYDCCQLESDALKHLQNTPQLESLSIYECCQLERDALKYLHYIKQLQSLNINGCTQLEPDALKHLQYTTQLQILKIDWCNQLDKTLLPKHLKL